MFADITLSTEAVVTIGALLATLGGVVAFLFRMLIAAKDADLADMKEQRDGYKKLAASAAASMEDAAVRRQQAQGATPVPMVAPVAAQHNSPTSEKQQEAADFATLQARVVAAQLVIDAPIPAPLTPTIAQQKLGEIQVKADEIKHAAEELVPDARGFLGRPAVPQTEDTAKRPKRPEEK
jgi:hypothetical protein